MFGFKKKYKDFISPKEEIKESPSATLKDIISGNVLSKDVVVHHIPFILFIACLLIYYISNRYQSEQVYKDMVNLEKELKELRFESITTASSLMYMSKQSEVLKRVNKEGLDLVESTEPPIKIYLEE
ncbi:FtsL-like putative cell division protein [Ancylomarina sp. 16SWW S1-10-2]|uniref:FtsL-like putative cell division protein n=1 Tax=Ancylomarina sp. 16SWW S1-10-2 TaxID=2499681 RepID=UPI0012AE678D|nr:FtsL-like putative cell division protein [Ancylomarina sp. 16SWW S1-10-2]MRT94196.1 hypothetical protein [Ancylomarina sp. 16SWW S1-10-2]